MYQFIRKFILANIIAAMTRLCWNLIGLWCNTSKRLMQRSIFGPAKCGETNHKCFCSIFMLNFIDSFICPIKCQHLSLRTQCTWRSHKIHESREMKSPMAFPICSIYWCMSNDELCQSMITNCLLLHPLFIWDQLPFTSKRKSEVNFPLVFSAMQSSYWMYCSHACHKTVSLVTANFEISKIESSKTTKFRQNQ